MKKTYLVTGGSGFLGSALVRRMIRDGYTVKVFDDNSRGSLARLEDVRGSFEFIEGDIRNPEAVERAAQGVDAICHMAFINGTEFFYSRPELVLEVGVKGIMNVIDACRKHNIGELILASSSEVYQTPPQVPTPETVHLVVPDPLNPRYSYGAGKIISEVVALNYGRTLLDRVVIFRPHNVYGPDMGWEHVVPQFVVRMQEACRQPEDPIRFPIQGTGKQTRSFIYINDFTDGLMLTIEKGEHLGIYHIGTVDEVSVEDLATLVGEYFERRVVVMPSEAPLGGTMRRCPDITKLTTLGFRSKYTLRDGVWPTAAWYAKHSDRRPSRLNPTPVAPIPEHTAIQEEK